MSGKHHRKAKQPKPLGKSEYKDLVAPMHLNWCAWPNGCRPRAGAWSC